jgi:hypothetical protein
MVLLILDGQSTYTLSLATIEVPRKHGVVHAAAAFTQHASNAASRCHVYQDIEYISARSEAEVETWAATVDRTYCVAGGHGVPKGWNDGNDYEWVQE